MRGSAPRRRYVGARGLIQIRDQLSDRDLGVIRQVIELRLMSARQIQALHFPNGAHLSEASATRARQRVLARLIRDGLLAPLRRRVGGVRAGSAGLVVTAGPLARRVLRLEGPRRRAYEPTERFFAHTLAVSQIVVDLTLAARDGFLDSLEVQAEPSCWRQFASLGGRRLLRPDLYLALGAGEYELRWFCEVDQATESLPVILRKCRLYADYYQSGSEQAQHGVFPRVCWIAPDETRAERIETAITSDRRLPERLFLVTTATQAVVTLSSHK